MAGGDDAMRERLIQTFELFEFGVEMMAANLRRRHPEATPEQIEQMVDDWLAEPRDSETPEVPVSVTRPR